MRNRLLLLISVLGICLLGCGKKEPGSDSLSEQDKGKEASFVCSRTVGDGFLTENFALYHNNHGRLQIFDAASKKDIVYCFDPGCEHKPARWSHTGELLSEGCISYEFSDMPVMLQGEKCYFLNDRGEVYVSDRQGENRRLLARIPGYIIIPDMVMFSQEYMFITYTNPYEMIPRKNEDGSDEWIVGNIKDMETCGIISVDLKNGAISELFHVEAYNARIAKADIRAGHLYFEYFYLDIPYVGPDLETYGPSGMVPEWLTVENYWDEMPKHQWMDLYDYDMQRSSLHTILSKKQSATVVFGEAFFAVVEGDSQTDLYRYDGTRFRQLDFAVKISVRSDKGLVCDSTAEPGVYRLIDVDTGAVLKQAKVSIPYSVFNPSCIIGESCYGVASCSKGLGAGYLSADDFWNGRYENSVVFDVFTDD